MQRNGDELYSEDALSLPYNISGYKRDVVNRYNNQPYNRPVYNNDSGSDSGSDYDSGSGSDSGSDYDSGSGSDSGSDYDSDDNYNDYNGNDYNNRNYNNYYNTDATQYHLHSQME